MRQTKKAVKGIYVAWMLGAEIEIHHKCNGYWQTHEAYDSLPEPLQTYYIWMAMNKVYDSEASEQACRDVTFRIKPENSDATD